MRRFCLALCVLVAAAGCGVTALTPSIPSEALLEGRVTGAPDVATVTRSMAAAGRRNRVAGYYWVGYTPVEFGTGDLSDLGGGDGFTFGVGLSFSESGRSFLEIAFEKTVNHSYAPFLAAGTGSQTGHHERMLIGGRSSGTAASHKGRQPRPYLSYGVANNKFRVDVAAGGSYEATGFGLYVGVGLEFPLAQKTAFSFDTRYHTWAATDTNGLSGQFSSLGMSLLWISRF